MARTRKDVLHIGNPDAVKLGAGLLYLAPLGTTEPTDLTTPWATVDADWAPVGYTEEGHEFNAETSYEAIEVAEEDEPIRYEETGTTIVVSFAMAEMTVNNVQVAFNGGTITSGAGINTFEPPAVGAPKTRRMLGWESRDGLERLVLRRVLQTGAVNIARRKAPDYATIPVEFSSEKVSGVPSFKWVFDA